MRISTKDLKKLDSPKSKGQKKNLANQANRNWYRRKLVRMGVTRRDHARSYLKTEFLG